MRTSIPLRRTFTAGAIAIFALSCSDASSDPSTPDPSGSVVPPPPAAVRAGSHEDRLSNFSTLSAALDLPAGGTSSGSSGSGGSGGSAVPPAGGSAGTVGTPPAPVPPPSSKFCGDAIPGDLDEECDDGPGDNDDLCSSSCQLIDNLAVPPNPLRKSRRLGRGRHSVAAGAQGFAVAFVETDSTAPSIRISAFELSGKRVGVTRVGTANTFVEFANPVTAALPDGSYAVAWTDRDGDGDQLGIALQRVVPGSVPAATRGYANGNRSFSQHDADLIWTGSELVAAWVDDSNFATAPDLRYRRFDANLNPLSDDETLGGTVGQESAVALAAFNGGFAAAWHQTNESGTAEVVVKIGARQWSLGPVLPAGANDSPALVALDANRIWVVFAVATDPLKTGVANVSRLRGAIIDTRTAASGPVFEINPLQATYVSNAAISQSEPSAIRIGNQVFLSWRSGSLVEDAIDEELWIKSIAWSETLGTLSLIHPEKPLVRGAFNTASDQRSPTLAAAPVLPNGALVLAWDDYGENLRPGQGKVDVGVQLMPTPRSWWGQQFYSLNFGTIGQGTHSLVGSGMQMHGAYSFPAGVSLRLFDGATTQKDGTYTIAFKAKSPSFGTFERITHHIPTKVPKQGSPRFDGSAFDGTALWLGHSRFQPGLAPAIGSDSPTTTGVRWDGSTGAAEKATDLRGSAAQLVQIPITQNTVTKKSFLISAQVYVPRHQEIEGAQPGIVAGYKVRMQPYVERQGYGLTIPGGLGFFQADFASRLDMWNLVEIRADFVTNGGALADSSDDTGSVEYSYFVNGIRLGAPQKFDFLSQWLQLATGPVRFAPGFGLTYGFNLDTPEAFIDDITVSEVAGATANSGLGYRFCDAYTQQDDFPFTVGLSPTPDGSAANPYRICNRQQLERISQQPTASFRLMKDVDLTGLSQPLATDTFYGTFDGSGRTLANLTLTRETEFAGLFLKTDGDATEDGFRDGIVKNLFARNFRVTGWRFVGAVVGSVGSPGIRNVHVVGGFVRSDKRESAYTGGLAGFARGLIQDSSSSARVLNDEAVNPVPHPVAIGGLVGKSGPIYRSYSTGEIRTAGYQVGGLVGNLGGPVTDSWASGIVVGGANVGGLVGYSLISGTLTNTAAYGNVTSRLGVVGGLVATCDHCRIVSSFARGKILGGPIAGGLVGHTGGDPSYIRRSFATGDVTVAASSNAEVGGLVGRVTGGEISDCYALGNVTGEGKAGGLVGNVQIPVSAAAAKILRNYSVGKVSSTIAPVGGSIGNVEGVAQFAGVFWNKDVNALSSIGGGAEPGTVFGVGGAALKQAATFTAQSWDFVSTWQVDEGKSYPMLLVTASTPLARTAVVRPGEVVAAPSYALNFGTAGSGDETLTSSGFLNYDGLAASGGTNLRFFDGAGSQTSGVYDIGFKGTSSNVITHHMPVVVPAMGGSLFGSGTFDGTALWVGHSRFKQGAAPALNLSSPSESGTLWNNQPGTANTNSAARVTNDRLLEIPVVQNVVTKKVFVVSAHVFVPTHVGTPGAYYVRLQPHLERDTRALTGSGGMGMQAIGFQQALDRWNLVEIRAEFITNGGALADSSDDTVQVTYEFYLNGMIEGGPRVEAVNQTNLTSRTGPLRFGPGFGLLRGGHADAAEAFVDNISVSAIGVPVP